MFANSQQSRIERYSQFPPTIEVEQNSYQRNNDQSELIFSRESIQQLMQIDQQSLVLKIGKLIHELVKTKQKAFLYEDLCKNLRKENEGIQEELKYLKFKVEQNYRQFQQAKIIIQGKEKIQDKLKKQKNQLINEIKALKQKIQEQKVHLPFQGVQKIKKKNKQLSKINELLQKELKIANSKVIELQKTMQQKACRIFVGQLHRLKQNSIKSSMLHAQGSPIRQKHMPSQPPIVGLQPYHRLRAYSTKNYRV